MELIINTGDTTTNRLIEFRISNNNANIEFNFDGYKASFVKSEWNDFVKEVNKRELVYWQEGKGKRPLNTKEFINLFKNIRTTAAYQLFLAGIDVANFVKFDRIFEPKVYEQNLDFQKPESYDLTNIFKYLLYFTSTLSGVSISIDNSLTIFPEAYYARTPKTILNELINANKLGQISFKLAGDTIVNFIYKPYLTPIVSNIELSKEAKTELSKIYSYLKSE